MKSVDFFILSILYCQNYPFIDQSRFQKTLYTQLTFSNVSINLKLKFLLMYFFLSHPTSDHFITQLTLILNLFKKSSLSFSSMLSYLYKIIYEYENIIIKRLLLFHNFLILRNDTYIQVQFS